MKNKLGFTLIEIMIALVIFTLLAAITSSTLYHAFDTRERVNMQAKQLNALQITLTLLSRDIEQILERSVLGNEMHVFPPFIGQPNYVEFTRGGIINPTINKRQSTLKRVAYLCTNHQLIRRTWEYLDSQNRKNYHNKTILDNINDCSFSYLGHDHQLLKEWRAYAIQQNQQQETLPLAIQLTFTLNEWGNASLLFAIPEALYAAD